MTRSGSSGLPNVLRASSSRFRFNFSCRLHSFAAQDEHLEDGSPRAPCLLFLLRNKNSSLGLRVLQSWQWKRDSCSMAAERFRLTLARRSLNIMLCLCFRHLYFSQPQPQEIYQILYTMRAVPTTIYGLRSITCQICLHLTLLNRPSSSNKDIKI